MSVEASSADLVRQCLERIARLDRAGPRYGAVLTLNPEAENEAERLDALRARSGPLGPLHGLPILVKDNIDVAGLPTSIGTKALKDWKPERDATVVARLKAAGAVVLGKTNLHEMALGGITASAAGGQTLNPYDPTRTPGGSSGGSGAALAAEFCFGALGTDTLNSLRSPASACGIVAIRPTHGLLPRTGLAPVSPSQDEVGPMARSVRDAAAMLDAMIGPVDPADPASALSLGRPQGGYLAGLAGATLEGARIGLLSNLVGRNGEQAEIGALVDAALRVFRAKGATVVAIDDDAFDTDRMLETLDVHLLEYREAFEAWLETVRPRPPLADLRAYAAAKAFDPSIAGPLEKLLRFARPTDAPDYLERRRRAGALRARVLGLFERHRLDAMVYPLQKCPTVKIGAGPQRDRSGMLSAATGLPAIDIPAGLTAGPPAVPVGIDLLGPPWSERRLLALAHAAQAALAISFPPLPV